MNEKKQEFEISDAMALMVIILSIGILLLIGWVAGYFSTHKEADDYEISLGRGYEFSFGEEFEDSICVTLHNNGWPVHSDCMSLQDNTKELEELSHKVGMLEKYLGIGVVTKESEECHKWLKDCADGESECSIDLSENRQIIFSPNICWYEAYEKVDDK